MERQKEMEQEDADLFVEINDWFSHNLFWPEVCKKQEPVVCYFKTENSKEMIQAALSRNHKKDRNTAVSAFLRYNANAEKTEKTPE